MPLRQLDATTFVSGQIFPEAVGDLAARGITAIVNNRPDGEQPGQPASAEIENAAHAAGLAYVHIPVAGGFTAAQIQAMADALRSANGPILAYCAAGTRSTYLWALARASAGVDGEALIRGAAAAGFDISALRPYLGPGG